MGVRVTAFWLAKRGAACYYSTDAKHYCDRERRTKMKLLSAVATLCATCCTLRFAEAAAKRALLSSCTAERNDCIADEQGCAPCMTAVAKNATAVPAVCDAEGLAAFRASLSSCDESESGTVMQTLEECMAVHAAGNCDASLSDPCAAEVSHAALMMRNAV